jgi:uncharacterized protein YqeY
MRIKKDIPIYDEIKSDIKTFMNNRDQKSLSSLRVILGELQRNPDKDYSDKSVLKQLKTLRKVTLKSPDPDYLIVSLIDTYIPEPVTTPEIKEWLKVNGYDKDSISKLKNPMMLIGIINKSFTDRDVDGKVVKNLITDIMNGVDGVKEKENMNKYIDILATKDV